LRGDPGRARLGEGGARVNGEGRVRRRLPPRCGDDVGSTRATMSSRCSPLSARRTVRFSSLPRAGRNAALAAAWDGGAARHGAAPGHESAIAGAAPSTNAARAFAAPLQPTCLSPDRDRTYPAKLPHQRGRAKIFSPWRPWAWAESDRPLAGFPILPPNRGFILGPPVLREGRSRRRDAGTGAAIGSEAKGALAGRTPEIARKDGTAATPIASPRPGQGRLSRTLRRPRRMESGEASRAVPARPDAMAPCGRPALPTVRCSGARRFGARRRRRCHTAVAKSGKKRFQGGRRSCRFRPPGG
jgi:hypothetical protein